MDLSIASLFSIRFRFRSATRCQISACSGKLSLFVKKRPMMADDLVFKWPNRKHHEQDRIFEEFSEAVSVGNHALYANIRI